jgi:bifunctional enzyme CysN/CysC
MLRNAKWERSVIGPARRAARFGQRAALVLITGREHVDRKGLARALEARLFEEGYLVYFLGIGNVLYGVDADIERTRENRHEHVRRLAEVANIVLDTGMMLIVTASELTREDLDLFRTTVDPERIRSVWMGDAGDTDFEPDLRVDEGGDPMERAGRIRILLESQGFLGPA